MNILFLTRCLEYGGAERQLVVLAKGLARRGHQVTVALFYDGGPLQADLARAGVTIAPLGKKGRWDMVSFILRLVRQVRRRRPDILHGYLSVPNLLTVLLKPFFPRIRMIWGVRASDMDLSKYDWLARLVFRTECLFSRFADQVIVNSQAGREYHSMHGFPANKMMVIPNGTDTDHFVPDLCARDRVRKEWGIQEDQKLIGVVARLDPIKDHQTFLRAAALASKAREDVRFVIVGDGAAPYRSELEGMAASLGLISSLVWAGARSDMPSVYNALDIMTLTSTSEGFPNVICEAMSCGVPCVATDAGDSAWIVGDTGRIVEVGNAEALVEAWQQVLAEGRDRLAVRERIVNSFGIERLLVSTEDVLCQKLS